MTSHVHARTIGLNKRYAPTRTPPNSPRNGPRVGILALFSVIGLYALGFVAWGLNLSGSFGVTSSSHSDNRDDVQLSSQLMRQLRRRAGGGRAIAADNKWMEQLLESGSRPPDLRCIGWRQTDSCDLKATEVPTKNRGCDQFVRGGVGGYCLMEVEATGQQVQVMHTACDTLHPSVMLSCRHAGDFVDFQWEVAKLALEIEKEKETSHEDTLTSATESKSEGILMVIYPKLLVSAYASIRALRAVNCTLPVELWYIESEMELDHGASLLNDVPKKLQEEYGPLTLHPITDPRVAGFNSKVWAITHTKVKHVLFLDADNTLVRDPSYLFQTPEFIQMGAVFWPDFWHPAHTIFNINEDSLLWELLDMPYIDMFEQESGQLVIDKTRSLAALRMLSLFAFHDPNLFSRYKLAHGDKDLFRLAWLKTNTPFHMVANPPGIAGTVRETKFCGMSMVQFDTEGEVLFLHRNAKKLTGGLGAKHKPDELIWTHLQRFRYRAPSPHAAEVEAAFEASKPTLPPNEKIDSPRVPVGNLNMPYSLLCRKYSVQIFNGAPEFDETQWCYGQSMLTAPRYKTIAWEETKFHNAERNLLQYAHEAVALLPEAAVEKIVQSDREEAK